MTNRDRGWQKCSKDVLFFPTPSTFSSSEHARFPFRLFVGRVSRPSVLCAFFFFFFSLSCFLFSLFALFLTIIRSVLVVPIVVLLLLVFFLLHLLGSIPPRYSLYFLCHPCLSRAFFLSPQFQISFFLPLPH